MDEPRRPPSDVPLYAALTVGAALTLGCLTAWFGPAMIWLVITATGLSFLGAFHYWMWGRGMKDDNV